MVIFPSKFIQTVSAGGLAVKGFSPTAAPDAVTAQKWFILVRTKWLLVITAPAPVDLIVGGVGGGIAPDKVARTLETPENAKLVTHSQIHGKKILMISSE